MIRAHPTKRDAPVPPSVNAAPNWISNSGFSYDSGGNMIADDTGRSYQWDAEGRVKSVDNGALASYTYDGDGWRVKKSDGTLYWRLVGDEVLAESDLSGAVQREYIYYGGERIARRDADGSVYYFFADRLGSAGVVTDAQGFYKDIRLFYPYGGIQRSLNWGVDNRYQYTGMERDAETGLDDTLFRKYSSNFARWYSPDPIAGSIFNPQSLNRYAYVLNNPVNFTDPLGLDCTNPTEEDPCVWGGTTVITVTGSGTPVPPVHISSGPGNMGYASGILGACTIVDFGSGMVELLCDSRIRPSPRGNVGGGSGGDTTNATDSGFTLGLGVADQSFGQCMEQNANSYSLGGSFELAFNVATGTDTSYSSSFIPSVMAGNNINTFFFGPSAQAAGSMAANAPSVISAGMGSPVSWGRRTTDIMSLNLAGKGGVPLALGRPAAGVKATLGKVGSALNLGMSFTTKLAVDAAFTAAEAIGCSMIRGR